MTGQQPDDRHSSLAPPRELEFGIGLGGIPGICENLEFGQSEFHEPGRNWELGDLEFLELAGIRRIRSPDFGI